jgi:hypothetical protein
MDVAKVSVPSYLAMLASLGAIPRQIVTTAVRAVRAIGETTTVASYALSRGAGQLAAGSAVVAITGLRETI